MGRVRWVILVFASWACGNSATAPSSVLLGLWGGDHIAVTIAAASAHFEFDCATGDIAGPFTVDARSQFYVAGTFTPERGGPVTEPPPPPDQHPAVYSGSINGSAMTLSVQLTDSQTLVGVFTLTRGSPGRLVRCVLPLAGP